MDDKTIEQFLTGLAADALRTTVTSSKRFFDSKVKQVGVVVTARR